MSRVLKTKTNQVTQKYGKTPYDNNHLGVDVVGYYNALDYIIAHSDGVVTIVQDGYDNNTRSSGMATYGNMIELEHGDGYKTRYAHLQKGLSLKKGDKVKKGQVIGYMGNTGNSYGAHLHFEVWDKNGRIDPEPYLDKDLPTSDATVSYQAYTNKWLPEVNKADNTYEGFAGINNEAITAFRCKKDNDELIYQASTLNGGYLSEVSSKDYNANNYNSYAGILGKPIDRIRIKSTKGKVTYRVKTREDGWLDWVSKYGDKYDEFAGIKGHTIIGIQIR